MIIYVFQGWRGRIYQLPSCYNRNGRVSQPRIQIPNTSVEESSAESSLSQDVICESSGSQPTYNNNSLVEVKSVPTSNVNISGELCVVQSR